MLGDLAPFVRDRERNRETREYEVRVGVQNEKMAFSFSFVMFLPWKTKQKKNQTISFLCCKIRFLFGIRGDERDHKSNVSLIQGLKWNHTLTPSAKGTLNTSAHGPDSTANLTAYSSWRWGQRLSVAFDTHSGPVYPLHSSFTCEAPQLKINLKVQENLSDSIWRCKETRICSSLPHTMGKQTSRQKKSGDSLKSLN